MSLYTNTHRLFILVTTGKLHNTLRNLTLTVLSKINQNFKKSIMANYIAENVQLSKYQNQLLFKPK